MDVISIARQLGKALQEEEAYKKMVAAAAANDANAELQEDIEKFNLLRLQLNEEISKQDSDKEKVENIQKELSALYEKVTVDPNMIAFNDARTELETLLDKVNQIITAAASGDDPETYEIHDHSSCGGNCSSCSGCH